MIKPPLQLLEKTETVVDATGAAVAHFFHGTTEEHRKDAHELALFFVEAYNNQHAAIAQSK